MELSDEDVQTTLTRWCNEGRTLYAVVYEGRAMRAVTGMITSLDGDRAIIADAETAVRLPIRGVESSIVVQGVETRSLTLAWDDGSAFLVIR